MSSDGRRSGDGAAVSSNRRRFADGAAMSSDRRRSSDGAAVCGDVQRFIFLWFEDGECFYGLKMKCRQNENEM